MQIMAIVLAAGQGKRMKSKTYKVLHPVCGKPMLGYVMDAVGGLQPEREIVVIGHGADAVRAYLGDRIEFAYQEQQLGTGHAVMQVSSLLADQEGVTIVVYGDTPLIRAESLKAMLNYHLEKQAAATLMTAVMNDPKGYGRMIRDESGMLVGIVEDKDCTPEQRLIGEINTGIYCFDNKKLFAALRQVTNDNAQNEYYLTDVIHILKNQGEVIEGWTLEDASESQGVNDRIGLSEVEAMMRKRIQKRHMLEGVTIVDPATTYIESGVTIGRDTVLWPGTVLRGKTSIGSECKIGPQSELTDSLVRDRVTVKQSVLLEAEVDDDTTIGPFAYLRPQAKIGKGVKIGDFVEIKNAAIGDGSKVPHLSYVGDARIGQNVNMGCGSITVNYDGFNKSLTEVEDGAFVGSNVNLIAPVHIGKGAYVVAGSTITRDVEENALAIARERQTNKPQYADKIRAKMKSRKLVQNSTKE